MDRETLDALIARAQGGDLPAFRELLASHQPLVRRFARAYCSSETDADDLAQDALVKVYKNLRLFRYQSAFSTWLYALVRNVFLDSARSRAGKERSVEEALAPAHTRELAADGAPDEHLHREQERQRLWRALQRAPLEYRSALVLFDIEGKSYDEVAAIEGVPVGTVKSRLNRGRAFLRQALLVDEPADRPVVSSGTSVAPVPSNDPRSGR